MRLLPVLALVLPLAAGAQTLGDGDAASARNRSGEVQVPLPPYPKAENYLPFEVSATVPFAFFVDAKSLSIGSDGVMRYALIAKSTDGVLNISFEGIRCADRQYRIYAFGRVDNTWSEARNSKWQAIRSDTRNPQRAVLYSDYFCPFAAPVTSVEQAVRVLRSGGTRATPASD